MFKSNIPHEQQIGDIWQQIHDSLYYLIRFHVNTMHTAELQFQNHMEWSKYFLLISLASKYMEFLFVILI